ncbi:MAG: ATP-binding protein [Acidobacteria bacterium RIFCSPLOWO2_12_FULL_59_11]|nr:MAG: ATP-binding protein [Acidobacteria bacterium RIFCSPLOWO2_12_FULL_59_11]
MLSWSSGKDSAWALRVLSQQKKLHVVALLTTINQAAERVAMHAVRRILVQAQADAAGLPLWELPLPWPCSNTEYERLMSDFCRRAVSQGIQAIAFGDLFLTDVRKYREQKLRGTGLEPLFPIWGMPTRKLALEMIASGLHAKITCVDPRVLSREFVGREFDQNFLADLPADVDPCGENGEFHSFAYAGPMFRYPVSVSLGEIVERDEFVFADLLPVSGSTPRTEQQSWTPPGPE